MELLLAKKEQGTIMIDISNYIANTHYFSLANNVYLNMVYVISTKGWQNSGVPIYCQLGFSIVGTIHVYAYDFGAGIIVYIIIALFYL